VHHAVRKEQRHRQVIRRSLLPKFADRCKVHRAALVGQPATEDDPSLDDPPYRAIAEFVRQERLEGRAGHIYLRAWFPQKALAHDQRIKREHEQAHPPDRNFATEKPLA